jgi:hypothetical protein
MGWRPIGLSTLPLSSLKLICSVIKSVGVYPYCFLSKECGIERMDNPVKLIREKLEDIGIAV